MSRLPFSLQHQRVANLAVTIARSLTLTFGGSRRKVVPLFLLARLIGAIFALFLSTFFQTERDSEQ
jgi:hypothetical protein